MNKGYIKIHRKIRDSWLWEEDEKEKFSYTQAWIDLLIEANYIKKKYAMVKTLMLLKEVLYILLNSNCKQNWDGQTLK